MSSGSCWLIPLSGLVPEVVCFETTKAIRFVVLALDGDISLGRAMPHQPGDSLAVVVLDKSLMSQFTINFCSRISLFNVFFFTLFYSLSSLTLWGLLCVSISDLVRSSGSTKGWFPCFWFISGFFHLSNFSLFFIGSCFILFQS